MVAGSKTHDPDKVIKKLFVKGLNFPVPPPKLNSAEYLAPYELMFRDVKNLSVEDDILDRIKIDLKKICISSLDRYKFEELI